MAGCGGGSDGTQQPPDPGPQEPEPNPGEERSAIQSAISTARTLLATVTAAGEGVTAEQLAAAQGAVTDAMMAIGVADDLAADEITRWTNDLAVISASLATAQTAYDDRVEAKALADAQGAASTAAGAARTAATNARSAADRVAELGPDTPAATEAGEFATAAETAAAAAETASQMAQDATTSDDAEMHQATAEAQRDIAQQAERDAEHLKTVAENTQGIIDRGVEARAIAAAQDAAKDALDAANESLAAARMSAEEAREAANEARGEANRAMASRTDYANAHAEATKAEDAATAAENALAMAMAARDAAQTAYDSAMSATTSADAEMHQETAEGEQAKAATQASNAATEKGNADTANMAAMTAADTHVLALLLKANAVGEMDDAATPNVDEQAEALMAMVTAINTAAGAADNGSGGTTVSATWPADTAATDDAEAVLGMLSIALDPEAGGALTFRTEAVAG